MIERRPMGRLAAAATLALSAACASGGSGAGAPEPGDTLLADLLASRPDLFADVLEDPAAHRLKVELVVVEEGEGGPRLRRHTYDQGPAYFYPASTVKTAAVIAAFLELDRLERGGVGTDGADGWTPGPAAGAPVGRDTALRFHPLFEGEGLEERDPSHVDGGTITAGHEARKVLLISDNAAYNRLYELAGNDGVNGALRDAGLDRTTIFHRLSEFRSPADQLRVPAIDLLDGTGRVIASTPERTAPVPGTNAGVGGLELGDAHTSGGEVLAGPMSFAQKNHMPLGDLVDMNIMLLRPDLLGALRHERGGKPTVGFPLTEDDRRFIRAAMASTPGESEDPRYDPVKYPADYSKFLLPGLLRVRSMDELVVRDKVGRAYGFSITNSEVVDLRTGRTFFLAATLYTNPNGVVGDSVYDYGRADRFLGDLGEVVGRAVLGD